MKSRAYILLNVINETPQQVANKLRGMVGVKEVEVLEGSPELMVIMEAKERKQLARSTVSALESIDTMLGTIKLMPVQEIHKAARPKKTAAENYRHVPAIQPKPVPAEMAYSR
jgi:hypothetical protein